MTDQTAPKPPSGWPFPETQATAQSAEEQVASREKQDPVEQALVNEQIAQDKKKTQAVDSALPHSGEQ